MYVSESNGKYYIFPPNVLKSLLETSLSESANAVCEMDYKDYLHRIIATYRAFDTYIYIYCYAFNSLLFGPVDIMVSTNINGTEIAIAIMLVTKNIFVKVLRPISFSSSLSASGSLIDLRLARIRLLWFSCVRRCSFQSKCGTS